MEKTSRILVAGAAGLVGTSLCNSLNAKGFQNILIPKRTDLDLLDQKAVNQFFRKNRPEYVFVAAAKVGGIYANSTYPADFIYENLVIATNLIHAAHIHKTKKLLYLGSSCIYPKDCSQPMKEEYLLSGPLETSNEAYAIAKIAGLKLCKHYRAQYGDDFVAVMPTNLYGPNDNFHPQNSHLLPGILRRIHEAKVKKLNEVVVWGSGRPVRELLYVDDLSEALIVIMEKYSSSDIINIGTGQGLTIANIAKIAKEIVGYQGKLVFDQTKPDGTPRKVLNIDKISQLGWSPKVSLEEGMAKTYHWALQAQAFSEQKKKKQKTSDTDIQL